MFSKEFVFSNKIQLYNEKEGFGFVTEKNRNEKEELQIPELNTGFNVPYWYKGIELTEIKYDEAGCFVESEHIVKEYGAEPGRLIPICFKADVEWDGNYEITLKLSGFGEVLVFAGPRRLVFRKTIGDALKKEAANEECRFVLNVCDIIPRGKVNLAERRSIDISVLGSHVKLASVNYRKITCPTIYIAGDSTVTDQCADYPYAPETSYSGWGQMLSAYVTTDAAVSNHAHSGLTTESFRSEGHYAIVQSLIKPGDYLFLQFAHNDQKLDYLKAAGGYRERMCSYIDEARKQGAYPVIVTPLARNTWKATEGIYNDLLSEYADECIKIGKEYGVPVADLHGKSMKLITKLGLTDAKRYFYPKDYTHTNDFGAYLMAGYVVEELRRVLPMYQQSGYQRLLGVLSDSCGLWQAKEEPPKEPKAPEQFTMQQIKETEKEGSNELERPEDILTRVEALDFVIKATKLFPTNVFNDEFEDVVGHEWYAGTVECAYQNGIIPNWMVEDKQLKPNRKVTLEELLCFMMNGYRCRKPFPEEKASAHDANCNPQCISQIRAAASLRLLKEDADLKKEITRREAKELCLALDV